jgi:chromosome segregation ATPase
MRAEPLGSLLASRGHITEEQLELALTEQKATGRPLGEIIVARGFASAPTVAQALATQHGGLLKTEYGFATGWGGQENSQARDHAPAPRNAEVYRLLAALEEHQKALDAWKQSHAQLEERLEQALEGAPATDVPGLAELEAERENMQAELSARDASIEQLEASVATVDAGRAELERALADEVERGAALRAELATAGASASVSGELEERLSGLEAEAAERLQAAAADFESARDRLEQQLAEARERTASLETELAARDAERAEVPPVPAGRWDFAESHLVFFQGAQGYELVERSGPPPSEGSSVGTQIVARISSAPIPGSALPCAYLVAG